MRPRRTARTAVATGALLALTGCASAAGPPAGAQPSPAPEISLLPIPEPSPVRVEAQSASLHVATLEGALLPNPTITPGSTYPDATAAMVCEPGYSLGVRNPRFSDKLAALATYSIPVSDRGSYQIDRLVPVSLGGDNSPANLWPQPKSEGQGSAEKNELEMWLREEVCSGVLTVEAARSEISTDWWRAFLARLPTRGTSPGPLVGSEAPGVDPVASFALCTTEGEIGRSAVKGVRFTCTATSDGTLRWTKRE